MVGQIQTSLNASPIRRFAISKLFGDRNVDIAFDSPITILVADNGSGKTTILSIIYAVLARQFSRLSKFDFESITIDTDKGAPITITHEMSQSGPMTTKIGHRLQRHFKNIPEDVLFQILEDTRGLPRSAFKAHPLVARVSDYLDIPTTYIYDMMRSELGMPDESDEPNLFSSFKARKQLSESFHYNCLYFPTYRRIEEELEDLGYTKKEGIKTEGLIRFGMNDVSQRIKDITGIIEKSSLEWFSRISGQMLSQLVDGIIVDDQVKASIRDQSALKIVLDRSGDNIGQLQKLRIMSLVESGEITQPKYETLAYFLSNLIKVYDQQREFDTSIKEFTRVCNKYLTDKFVVYDESKVDVNIVSKTSGIPVKLSKLSSGEKQIVSLFSRLYLEGSEKLALLFDEPELSLSIEWQKMLLPDILQSGRCSFLLATTHSPFIFENELDAQAYDLERFVQRVSS